MTVSITGATISGGVILGDYVAPFITSGLILSFDANNPSSYSGTGTTITDTVGSLSHTLSGGASYTVLNNVKCFNCATSGYYIECNTTGPQLATAGYTYMAWTRLQPNTSEWRTLWRTTPDDHPLLIQSGGTTLGMYDNNGTGFNSSGYDITPWNNVWAQWTVVGDTTNGSTFYINGSQVGTSVAQSAGGNYHKWIGGAAGSQPFGYIANCFLYNTKLTQAQINQNYQSLRERFAV
jgi:hypothetical protein